MFMYTYYFMFLLFITHSFFYLLQTQDRCSEWSQNSFVKKKMNIFAIKFSRPVIIALNSKYVQTILEHICQLVSLQTRFVHTVSNKVISFKNLGSNSFICHYNIIFLRYNYVRSFILCQIPVSFYFNKVEPFFVQCL